MNIKDVPEQYKSYTISMSNGSEYVVTGPQKEQIVLEKSQWIVLPTGTAINRSFVVEIKLNMDVTKENVKEHADEIRDALIKI